MLPNPVESLGYIKCYSSSSPRPVKALAILLYTTVRRSAVDQEDLRAVSVHISFTLDDDDNSEAIGSDAWEWSHPQNPILVMTTTTATKELLVLPTQKRR